MLPVLIPDWIDNNADLIFSLAASFTSFSILHFLPDL